MLEYGRTAADRGLAVIIAGAGGAAHLPGMLASVTPLPVIGVPVPLKHLDGLDSLLSIVQMPAGVPVATVAIGGARNAGLLAVRVLAASDAVATRPDDRVPGRAAQDGRAEGRGGPVADGRPQGRLLTSGLPPPARLVGVDVARCLALLGMMATHVLRETDPDGSISFSQCARRRSRVVAVRGAGRPEPGADDRSAAIPCAAGAARPLGRPGRARPARRAPRAGAGRASAVRAGGDPHLLRRPLPAAACRSWACAPAPCSCSARCLAAGRAAAVPPAPPAPAHARHASRRLRPARRSRSAARRAAVHRLLPGAAVADLPPGRDGAGAARPDPAPGAGDRSPRSAPRSPLWRQWCREASPGSTGSAHGPRLGPSDGGVAGHRPGPDPATACSAPRRAAVPGQWMLVVAPHSGTSFDLAQTSGARCLVSVLPAGGRRAAPVGCASSQVLFGAGAMTLTLYSLHV